MNVRSLVCCASGVLAACVCAGRVQAAVPYGFTTSLVVRADQQWTDTGIDLPLHSTVDTKATGVVQADGRLFEGHKRFDARVGPMGTVNYKDDEEHAFPIPVGMPTRAPAYALIGRIDGEGGTPFVLGQFAQTVSAGGGRLWLGINDYDVKDNEGTWRVELTVQKTKGAPAHAVPAAPVAARQPAAPGARPVPAVNAAWSTTDTIRAAAGMLTDVIAVEDAVTNGVSGTNSIPVVIAEQVRQQTNLINVELAQFPSITNTTRVEIDMSGATNVVMEFAFETNFPSAPQIKIVSTKKQAERGEEQEVYIYLDRVSLSDLQPSDTNTPLLSDYIGVNDPLETFNRAMFKTEEKIYVYFLGPVGKG
ncbi:VacJ family lipoprotein, partial [bacterium]|nr:VacJ family lipoprotein [bacterium]